MTKTLRGAGALAAALGLAPALASAETPEPMYHDGAIAGPSSALNAPPGAALAGIDRAPLTPEQLAERDNLPGFLKTPVEVMLVRAELDPSVAGDMTPLDHAGHDKLCAVDGPGAKDGIGHCPVMLYAKRHSDVSEVFANRVTVR